MSRENQRKLFTAERSLMKQGGVHAPVATSALDTQKILQAIEDLKESLLRSQGPHETVQMPEISVLKGQLYDLKESIDKTKKEIAAVRRPGADDDRLTNAAMELDAIVSATEEATHSILNATEDIDDRIEKLKERTGDVASAQILDEISAFTIKILEACNFQDISGQRTSKVIKTIHYLEERIGTMIDIWGAEEFDGVKVEEKKKTTEDEDLLHGPQLAGEGVSQDDIDALFD